MDYCVLCSPESGERSFWPGGRVNFARRFEGPKGRGHGGTGIALLGCAAEAAAGDRSLTPYRVAGRVQRPIPLAADLAARVERDGDGWSVAVMDGETAVLAGKAWLGDRSAARYHPVPEHLHSAVEKLRQLAATDPSGPFLTDEGAKRTGSEDEMTCFGCSRPRADGGLRMPGQRVAEGVAGSPLVPFPEFVGPSGHLSRTMASIATDCLTGLVRHIDGTTRRLESEGKTMFTGSLDYYILRRPPDAAAALTVLCTPLREEGRKFLSCSVLMDRSGTPYVVTESTWISVDMTEEQKRKMAAAQGRG